mmetsp:Transcript_25055/g.81591  ORF Transcript_25055/g.81591 Transcript_25055/m.81591 type:complete len:210 (-) Transcript_25055:437-1066(-)
MRRVRGQRRVRHRVHEPCQRVARLPPHGAIQPVGKLRRCRRLALNAQVEGAERSHQEPDLQCTRRRPDRRTVCAQLRGQRGVADAQRATDRVRMPRKVLGRRVHDNVCAKRQRALEGWRRERGVDDHPHATQFPRSVGVSSHVGHVAVRVARRFEPHHVALAQDGRRVLRCRQRDRVAACSARDTLELLKDLVRAVVASRDGDAARQQP